MADLDLAEVARRPQRYWDIDGLPELMMGLLWMLWGGAWLYGRTLPRDWRYNAYWTLTPALLALSGFAAVFVTKWLKARVTFPRTGYVEWREPSRRMRLTTAAVALVTASLLVIVISAGGARTERLVAPILAVILSLAFVVASLRQRAPLYLALAGVAIALGIAFGASQGGWESANWMLVVLGAACAAIGGVRLAVFFRKHPRVAAERP